MKVRKKNGYWNDMRNQKEFMERVRREKNFKSLEEWNKISTKEFHRLGGSSLLNHYKGSLQAALRQLYPEHPWNIFDRKNVPQKHWQKEENQREVFERVKERLQLSSPSDWYSLSISQVMAVGRDVRTVLKLYNDSLFLALRTLYPHIEWNPHARRNKSRAYWKSVENQTAFLNDFAKKFNVKKEEDWYSISNNQIRENGGRGLLFYYKTLPSVLKALYPSIEWNEGRFSAISKSRLWRDKQWRSESLRQIIRLAKIEKKSDWYRLSISQLRALCGSSFLYHVGLRDMLLEFYEDEKWPAALFKSRSKKAAQRSLFLLLSLLYPQHLLLEDYSLPLRTSLLAHLHSSLPSPPSSLHSSNLTHHFENININLPVYNNNNDNNNNNNNNENVNKEGGGEWSEERLKGELEKYLKKEEIVLQRVEIDVYIPNLNIGFEYQGEQHFDDYPEGFTPNQFYLDHDSQKLLLCRLFRIPLCTIPYWWDKSLSSLQSFILPFFP